MAAIDDREARARLDEARIEHEAAVRQSESRLSYEYALKSQQVAEADYQRAIDSNRSFAGAVSDTEMDRLKLLVQKHDAELEKIDFDQRQLELTARQKESIKQQRQIELARHQIDSVMNGVVTAINFRQGEWVNKSDTVFKIIRMDRLRVEELVPAAVANEELLGTAAAFQPMGENSESHPGTVVFIDPDVNPVNSLVRVWIEIENPKFDLRPGIKGRLTIFRPANGDDR